jgi:hypothetical protein
MRGGTPSGLVPLFTVTAVAGPANTTTSSGKLSSPNTLLNNLISPAHNSGRQHSRPHIQIIAKVVPD